MQAVREPYDDEVDEEEEEQEVSHEEEADVDDVEAEKSSEEVPIRPPPERAEDEPRASFSLRHPFQYIDPVITTLVVAGVGTLSALLWLLKRLKRRKRLDASTAWVWRDTTLAPVNGTSVVGQPLAGQRVVVCENVPLRGRPLGVGVPSAHPPAAADHPLVTGLVAAGATVAGAARLDPLALSGVFQTHAAAAAGNGGLPGRAVVGACGAAATIVAGGGAEIAVAADGGADMLLAAACVGCSAFRASDGAVDLSGCLRPSSSTCVASFALRDATLLHRVGKAMSLPGGGTPSDMMRVLFTYDLFELLDGLRGEKVTNGIVSRAVTTWLSDAEHARQIALLDWLAKELDKWTRFVEHEAGEQSSARVLEGVSRAHRVIVGYETAACVASSGASAADLPAAIAGELRLAQEVTREDYDAALEFRRELHTHMRDALRGATMLLPILAGSPPIVRGPAAPLDANGAAVMRLSAQFASLIAMCGFPTAVLPVPALGRRGGPWAVAVMGLYRMDLQVLSLASKLGPQIMKTAETMEKEAANPKKGGSKVGSGSPSPSAAAPSPAAAAAAAAAKAEELKDKGNEYFKAGEFVKSIQMYSTAIALSPRNAVYYSNRAMAYLKLQKYPEAIGDCDASIQIKWSAKAAMRRGTARAAIGLWQEALADFEAVVASEPRNMSAAQQAEECRTMLSSSVYANDGVTPAVAEGLL